MAGPGGGGGGGPKLDPEVIRVSNELQNILGQLELEEITVKDIRTRLDTDPQFLEDPDSGSKLANALKRDVDFSQKAARDTILLDLQTDLVPYETELLAVLGSGKSGEPVGTAYNLRSQESTHRIDPAVVGTVTVSQLQQMIEPYRTQIKEKYDRMRESLEEVRRRQRAIDDMRAWLAKVEDPNALKVARIDKELQEIYKNDQAEMVRRRGKGFVGMLQRFQGAAVPRMFLSAGLAALGFVPGATGVALAGQMILRAGSGAVIGQAGATKLIENQSVGLFERLKKEEVERLARASSAVPGGPAMLTKSAIDVEVATFMEAKDPTQVASLIQDYLARAANDEEREARLREITQAYSGMTHIATCRGLEISKTLADEDLAYRRVNKRPSNFFNTGSTWQRAVKGLAVGGLASAAGLTAGAFLTPVAGVAVSLALNTWIARLKSDKGEQFRRRAYANSGMVEGLQQGLLDYAKADPAHYDQVQAQFNAVSIEAGRNAATQKQWKGAILGGTVMTAAGLLFGHHPAAASTKESTTTNHASSGGVEGKTGAETLNQGETGAGSGPSVLEHHPEQLPETLHLDNVAQQHREINYFTSHIQFEHRDHPLSDDALAVKVRDAFIKENGNEYKGMFDAQTQHDHPAEFAARSHELLLEIKKGWQANPGTHLLDPHAILHNQGAGSSLNLAHEVIKGYLGQSGTHTYTPEQQDEAAHFLANKWDSDGHHFFVGDHTANEGALNVTTDPDQLTHGGINALTDAKEALAQLPPLPVDHHVTAAASQVGGTAVVPDHHLTGAAGTANLPDHHVTNGTDLGSHGSTNHPLNASHQAPSAVPTPSIEQAPNGLQITALEDHLKDVSASEVDPTNPDHLNPQEEGLLNSSFVEFLKNAAHQPGSPDQLTSWVNSIKEAAGHYHEALEMQLDKGVLTPWSPKTWEYYHQLRDSGLLKLYSDASAEQLRLPLIEKALENRLENTKDYIGDF